MFRGDYASAGTPKLAGADSCSFWIYGYFEQTRLAHVKVGAKTEIHLLSGQKLKGHVESISRGISLYARSLNWLTRRLSALA